MNYEIQIFFKNQSQMMRLMIFSRADDISSISAYYHPQWLNIISSGGLEFQESTIIDHR
jgi:hypothetical protein